MNGIVSIGNSCNGDINKIEWSEDLTTLETCFTFETSGNCSLTLNPSGNMKDLVGNSLVESSINFTIAGPLVAPAADVYKGTLPLLVNFTSVVALGTSPYIYSWEFGDGATSDEANPSHTFSSPGSYTVTLTVTDSEDIATSMPLFIQVLESFTIAAACSDLSDELSYDELVLAELINEYRVSSGFQEIGISRSLSRVARYHCHDLENNPPTGSCNAHSWSEYGPWTSCCYTADHAQSACMWNKPGELTPLHGNGYEIAYTYAGSYITASMDPDTAFAGWKESPLHNAVMINRYPWMNFAWQSMGIGLYKGSAVAWFAVEYDPCGYHEATLPDTPPLTVPRLRVEISGNHVILNWNKVENSDGNFLYWAFPDDEGNPKVSTLDYLDMKEETQLEINLPSGFSLFTAVLPYNRIGQGTFSNILYFQVP